MKVEVFKTEKKGWGLKVLEDLEKLVNYAMYKTTSCIEL